MKGGSPIGFNSGEISVTKRKNFPPRECAYCGKPATSKDHVPPKNLFSKGTDRLITVPACDQHNNAFSGLDERFREAVSFIVGVNTEHTKEIWQRVRGSFRRNPRRLLEIISTSIDISEINRKAILIDAQLMQDMGERIVKAFYWIQYKSRIDPNLSMQVSWIPIDEAISLLEGMHRRSIGNGQFFYAYGRLDSDPTVSMWLLIFHQSLAILVITDSDLVDRVSENFESS